MISLFKQPLHKNCKKEQMHLSKGPREYSIDELYISLLISINNKSSLLSISWIWTSINFVRSLNEVIAGVYSSISQISLQPNSTMVSTSARKLKSLKARVSFNSTERLLYVLLLTSLEQRNKALFPLTKSSS